jgi:hypothetical protein
MFVFAGAGVIIGIPIFRRTPLHLTAVHPTRPHSTAKGVSPAVVRARKAETFIWLVPAGALG